MYSYLTSQFLRADETNYWNKLNSLRIPTGRIWVSTNAAKELNQGLPRQLMVRGGISRFQVQGPNPTATQPPIKSLSSQLLISLHSICEERIIFELTLKLSEAGIR